ncbi:MAG: DNA alkylation repair protein [bacterium]|nr:DNA alkylation repair protein [bacterium]
MKSFNNLKQDLKKVSEPDRIADYQRFFKTKPGEYGENDLFIGVRVPAQRKVAKDYYHLSLQEIQELLNSKIHEHRLTALIILNYKFKKASEVDRNKIYKLYLKNINNINNWDLVDSSAHFVVGEYLRDKSREPLYKLAKSKDLWEKRIAIISTFKFIQHDDFDDSLKLAEILLQDEHDLIHKAVGWMLREVGNRDKKVEEKFLRKHYKKMPRTMLRYAIEKFPKNERDKYLKGII